MNAALSASARSTTCAASRRARLAATAREGRDRAYRAYLPVTDDTPIIRLGEGGTPLVPLERIGGTGYEVFPKFEGMNPTGSFKDRGMTMAVSKAVEAAHAAVICASTGNTSASAAAYAARAGIRAAVVIPEGKIAIGKLAQAIAHGARVISIDGNFDQALAVVRELADTSTSSWSTRSIRSGSPGR